MAEQLDSRLVLSVVIAVGLTLAAIAYLMLVRQLARHRRATGEV